MGLALGGEAGGEILGAADFVLVAATGEDGFIAGDLRAAHGGEAGLGGGGVGFGVGVEAAAGAEVAGAAAAVGEAITHGLVGPAVQVDVLEQARGDQGANH